MSRYEQRSLFTVQYATASIYIPALICQAFNKGACCKFVEVAKFDLCKQTGQQETPEGRHGRSELVVGDQHGAIPGNVPNSDRKSDIK